MSDSKDNLALTVVGAQGLSKDTEAPTLKWYEFSQNNSGGEFVVDSLVCHRVYVQAYSAAEANEKAEGLGIYFHGLGDCECCGRRWHEVGEYDAVKDIEKLKETWGKSKFKPVDTSGWKDIKDYVQYQADEWGWTSPDARMFYENGLVEEVFSKKIEEKKRKQIGD